MEKKATAEKSKSLGETDQTFRQLQPRNLGLGLRSEFNGLGTEENIRKTYTYVLEENPWSPGFRFKVTALMQSIRCLRGTFRTGNFSYGKPSVVPFSNMQPTDCPVLQHWKLWYAWILRHFGISQSSSVSSMERELFSSDDMKDYRAKSLSTKNLEPV